MGSLALATHHRTSGSAGTARGPCALDLAGALHALWRAECRGAREKGVDQEAVARRLSEHFWANGSVGKNKEHFSTRNLSIYLSTSWPNSDPQRSCSHLILP